MWKALNDDWFNVCVKFDMYEELPGTTLFSTLTPKTQVARCFSWYHNIFFSKNLKIFRWVSYVDERQSMQRCAQNGGLVAAKGPLATDWSPHYP